jgi:hypothetical protein
MFDKNADMLKNKVTTSAGDSKYKIIQELKALWEKYW